MDARFKTTYHAKVHKRRNSTIDLADAATSKVETLTAVKQLGAGSYGYVRLFQDAPGHYRVAVKTPHDEEKQFESPTEARETLDEVKREFEYRKTANPHRAPYALHFIAPEENEDGIVDYRMVTPYSSGINLDDSIDECEHTLDFARLVLRTAQELNRIHQQGIIHGDVSGRNVLVEKSNNDYIVEYIDYGLAYPVDGMARTGFVFDGSRSSVEMAPERFGSKKLPAHTNQDVYSLAKTFDNGLKRLGDEWRELVYENHSSIEYFIQEGLSLAPKLRPCLSDIISDLQGEIIFREIPKEYHRLISHLLEQRFVMAKKCLENNQRDYNTDVLNTIFYNLMKERHVDAAQFLLQQSSSIPIYKDLSGSTVFHLVADWGDHHIEVMDQLFNYVSARKLQVVLDSKDLNNDTPLCIAAKRDHLGMLVTILRHDQDILNKDQLLKNLITVAGPVVTPILKLANYLAIRTKHVARMTNSLHQKELTNTLNEVKAAKFLLNYIIQQYPHLSAIDYGEHRAVIEASEELSTFYFSLVGAKLLVPCPDLELKVESEAGSEQEKSAGLVGALVSFLGFS